MFEQAVDPEGAVVQGRQWELTIVCRAIGLEKGDRGSLHEHWYSILVSRMWICQYVQGQRRESALRVQRMGPVSTHDEVSTMRWKTREQGNLREHWNTTRVLSI